MKKPLFLALLLILCCLTAVNAGPLKVDNVVIDRITDTYRLIPADNNPTTLGKVKNSTEISYRALRSAETVAAMAYYNDAISIDKASGGKKVYGSYFSDDIFYSDAKACIVRIELDKADATGTAKFERTFNNVTLFDQFNLGESYRVKECVLKFIVPQSLMPRYNISLCNIPDSSYVVERTERGDKTELTYRIKNLAPMRGERLAPSVRARYPYVKVTGHFPTTDDLYGYLNSLADVHDPGEETVAKMAREVTAGCSTDSARVAAITDYVHRNIRYLAMEHGLMAFAPDLPSEVLRKRFGDCKGSAGLIRAMLRAVGLDGRRVWIGTESVATEWSEHLSLASGNHMIAAVMLGDSLHYIDGTATYIPYGRLPSGIQGRQTLVEGRDGAGCLLHRVPVLSPQVNSRRITYSYAMPAEGGELTGRFSERRTGAFTGDYLSMVENASQARQSSSLEKYISRIMPTCRATSVTHSGDMYQALIEADISSSTIVQRVATEAYVNLCPTTLLNEYIVDPKRRTASVLLPHLRTASHTVEVKYPEGYEVEYMPEALAVSNEWFDAEVTPVTESQKLSLTLSFTLKNRRVPLADINRYNTDLRKIIKQISSKAVITTNHE